ncbi:MAG TPA: C40 family peptidase [Mycobacteriales bacterium]|nr:C40 family peptidase [Mycobacteriales bacterium]
MSAATAARRSSARVRGDGFTGRRLVAALVILTLGTSVSAVAAVVVRHHGPATAAAAAAAGPLPPAPVDVLNPLQAPAAVNTPGLVARQRHRDSHLVTATLLVTGDRPLSRRAVHRLRHLSGVHRVQPVSAGHARVMGHKAFVLGVNPTTFRPWTPESTAASSALWQSIAGGDIAVSFDMGQNANLPLGGTVPVGDSRGITAMRVGAFASVGMAGVDAVFSGTRAQQLGMLPRTGVVISAPKADPLQLRHEALAVLGHKAHAELLRDVVIVRDAGEFLTRVQIANFLAAARSRIGLPYVWGAAGPASFDCSGLVQWAFRYAGVSMPRVSEEQWFTGPHIPYADARPGDLLFWHYDPKDPSDIDHVAIYYGNGMMIVAPHTGEYVSYEPVPLSNLAGVVRVDPALGAELS